MKAKQKREKQGNAKREREIEMKRDGKCALNISFKIAIKNHQS